MKKADFNNEYKAVRRTMPYESDYQLDNAKQVVVRLLPEVDTLARLNKLLIISPIGSIERRLVQNKIREVRGV